MAYSSDMVIAMAADKLAGVAEIVELLGVSKQTVINYTKRDDFPEPVDRLAAGPVWRRIDVERWARKYRPTIKPGRPPQKR